MVGVIYFKMIVSIIRSQMIWMKYFLCFSRRTKIERRNVVIYEASAQFGGEITALLRHTLLTVHVPSSLSLSAESRPFRPSVPPSPVVPPPPLKVYHCIFLLMRPDSPPPPNSNIASDIRYTHPTLKNKKRKEKIFLFLPRTILRLHSITAGPNFSFQAWNMIIFLFARNINCSRRTHNHWGGKEKLPV